MIAESSTVEPDPGLASERTMLAWQRTGLSAVTAGAAFLRLLQDARWDVLDEAVAATLIGTGVTAVVGGEALFRRRRSEATARPPTRVVALLVAATFIHAAAAFLLVVVGS